MNKPIVVCVDDEINILNALKRLLRQENYTLLTTHSCQEALDWLAKEPVHLILSDQRMPELTGVELLQKAKTICPAAVRVILSGYAEVGTIVESINKGEIYRFMSKPWNDDELKVAIQQCLAHYDLVEQNRLLLQQVQEQNEYLSRLNEDLEKAALERTQSLQLAQSVLWKLPVPILGIGLDGLIVMINESVKETFPQLQQVFLGADLHDVLPKEEVEAFERCLKGEPSVWLPSSIMAGRRIRTRATPVTDVGRITGCMITWDGELYANTK